MQTVYYHGIQNSKNTYWMGQKDQPAAPQKASPRIGQLEWLPGLLQTGGTAFGQYESAQAAEDAKKAAEARTAAAQAQTQTAAIQAQALANSQKIMGLEPGMFWGGLAVLATVTVVGVVVANKKN